MVREKSTLPVLRKPADHKKIAGLERPDGLFLVDGRCVVDQRTDQTCGVWPADFDALDTRHTRQFARSDTEVDLTRGKLGESGESQLQLVLATLSQIAGSGGARGAVKFAVTKMSRGSVRGLARRS